MERYLVRIREIAADRRHGARELYRWAAENLLMWMQERGSSHPEELIPLLAETAKAQPSMAPLLNLVNRVLLAWGESPKKAQTLLRDTLGSKSSFIARLVDEGLKVLKGKRIVTLSRSSTLLEVIKALLDQGEKPEILISEGRPLMGSVTTARLFYEMGAKVTLCTDGLIFSLLREGDVVSVGADAITPSYLVNRCGTYPLALVAQDRGIPFYTFTDTNKLLPAGLAPLFKIEDHDPAEVLKNAPFDVINYYFDKTPLRYLTGAVTEKGLLTPDRLHNLIETFPVSSAIKEVIAYVNA